MTLINDLKDICQRLAGMGWQDLLRRHGLDLGAADLAAELARPLVGINRNLPGFGDFTTAGMRGIEPGRPAASLLYAADGDLAGVAVWLRVIDAIGQLAITTPPGPVH